MFRKWSWSPVPCLSGLGFDKSPTLKRFCLYLPAASWMFACFISWLWELVCTVSVISTPKGMRIITALKSGGAWCGRPARCRSQAYWPTSLLFQWLLGAARLCQLSQECPCQPSRGQDLMLLFHAPAKSHIGRPCFITTPPCVWPWVNFAAFWTPNRYFSPSGEDLSYV